MKVLQVCAVGMTMEKLLLPLIDGMRAAGWQVEGVCSPGEEVERLRGRGYLIHSITIKRGLGLSNFCSIWQLWRLMQAGKYDVVHVHTPVAAVLGRIAARMARVPMIVYTAHGFYFHENMKRGKRFIWEGIEIFFGRYFTDLLFCQSQEDTDYATKAQMLKAGRIYAIGNGVDLQSFSKAACQVDVAAKRRELGIAPEARVVVFIGRAVAEKGIFELLEAFAGVREAVPEARLLLVGDNLAGERDQASKERLLDWVKEGSGIIVAGKRDDIPEILAAADCFVLPSWREGMPRSIIEAMAMELPVVATDIRGSREEVVDGETGLLVKLGDVDALAGAICEVLKNSQLAEDYGAAGRKRAEELFDEAKVIALQLDLIEKALS